MKNLQTVIKALSLCLGFILFSSTAKAQADLVIQNNIVYKKAPEVTPLGGLSIDISLYNQGGSNATASTIRYYVSTDNVLSSDDKPMLTSSSAGSSAASNYILYTMAGGKHRITRTIYAPANIAAGNYYVLFVADADNKVAESNENNNSNGHTLIVSSGASDLQISSASLNTSSVASGSQVTVTYTIKNQGSASVGGFNVKFSLTSGNPLFPNTQTLSEKAVTGMGGWQQKTLTATLTIPSNITSSPSRDIIIDVDSGNNIDETNETNNKRFLPIEILLTKPDLAVTSLSSTSATIKNLSNSAASNFKISYTFKQNGLVKKSGVVSKTYLGGNTSTQITYSTNGLAAGTYDLTVKADADNTVAESNEGNNEQTTQVTIEPAPEDLPDLIVTNYIYPKLGDNFVYVTAKNIGNKDVSSCAIAVYSNDYLGSKNISLKAGESKNVYINLYSPILGNVEVSIDPNNLIKESKENNNSIYVVLTSSFRSSQTQVKNQDKTFTKLETQAYPNPFIQKLNIRYGVPHTTRVVLKLYNMQGAEVATLVNKVQDKGEYTAQWQRNSQTKSGVYFYRLNIQGQTRSGKVILK